LLFHAALVAVTEEMSRGLRTTPSVTTLNPEVIKFSQSSVNATQVDLIEASMKKDGWKGAPIDVVQAPNGNLVTLDNKRVLTASRTGTQVQAVVRQADDVLPSNFVERFTTKNGGIPTTFGEALGNRINSQASGWRRRYPQGSQVTGTK
jgi:hypothetical protein